MKKLFVIIALVAAASVSAAAQDLAAVRRALVSPDGQYVFNLDFTGSMRTEATLQITAIDDFGTFTGFYTRGGEKRAASPNITDGKIQILSGTGLHAVSISFTPDVRPTKIGGVPLPVGITTFEGAIRLGAAGRTAFMAGIYRTGLDNAGPFPFCATLIYIPG